MTAFDPYYKWLGIPPEEQPPDHYRLLGLRRFESDPDVIEATADQRMSYVQRLATGNHLALSQKILNELAAARVCLLGAETRATYDRLLLPPSKLESIPQGGPATPSKDRKPKDGNIARDRQSSISAKDADLPPVAILAHVPFRQNERMRGIALLTRSAMVICGVVATFGIAMVAAKVIASRGRAGDYDQQISNRDAELALSHTTDAPVSPAEKSASTKTDPRPIEGLGNSESQPVQNHESAEKLTALANSSIKQLTTNEASHEAEPVSSGVSEGSVATSDASSLPKMVVAQQVFNNASSAAELPFSAEKLVPTSNPSTTSVENTVEEPTYNGRRIGEWMDDLFSSRWALNKLPHTFPGPGNPYLPSEDDKKKMAPIDALVAKELAAIEALAAASYEQPATSGLLVKRGSEMIDSRTNSDNVIDPRISIFESIRVCDKELNDSIPSTRFLTLAISQGIFPRIRAAGEKLRQRNRQHSPSMSGMSMGPYGTSMGTRGASKHLSLSPDGKQLEPTDAACIILGIIWNLKTARRDVVAVEKCLSDDVTEALVAIETNEEVPFLLDSLNDDDVNTRYRAILVLSEILDFSTFKEYKSGVAPGLVKACGDSSLPVRFQAGLLTAEMERYLLRQGRSTVKRNGVIVTGGLTDREHLLNYGWAECHTLVVPVFTEIVADSDREVVHFAIEELAKFGPNAAPAVPAIANAFQNGVLGKDEDDCIANIRRIGPASIPALIAALPSSTDAATRSLQWFGPQAKDALAVLMQLEKNELSESRRQRLRLAIQVISK